MKIETNVHPLPNLFPVARLLRKQSVSTSITNGCSELRQGKAEF